MAKKKTRHQELCDILTDAGFENGWVLVGETLTLWDHDEDPPAPLTKPATN